MCAGYVGPASDRRPGVADPVARARAAGGRAIAGVRETAAIEGEAAAADTVSEACLEALKLVDAGAPGSGEPRPVPAAWNAVGRQLAELAADLVEAQAHALGEDDERDPPDHRTSETAVARRGPNRGDQSALLVEAKGRRSDAAAPRDFADRQ